ncbi:hypothetical protein, partial [Paraburkholderia solisilvae]|uniref:hypothetical protein n=1 Tax=Paraburkholderia solisilvae TaxID=624376 RepID=UPI0015844709
MPLVLAGLGALAVLEVLAAPEVPVVPAVSELPAAPAAAVGRFVFVMPGNGGGGADAVQSFDTAAAPQSRDDGSRTVLAPRGSG